MGLISKAADTDLDVATPADALSPSGPPAVKTALAKGKTANEDIGRHLSSDNS